MGAFGSIISGAGQQAADFGQQARQIKLAQWGQLQDSLAKMISDAAAAATTPERQLDLHAFRSKVLKLKPGEDPSKIIQEAQSHLVLHPMAEKALTPEQPKPTPGPAGPGETPGRGTLNPMASLMAGGAAQPSTSPVSPQAQTSNYSSQSSQMPAPAPPPQAAAQITPPPVSQPQAQQSLQSAILPQYLSALQGGSMPPALEKIAQPFVSNEAELARTRGMREYQIHEQAPAVMDYLRKNIPGFDQLPDFIKSQYAIAAAGLQAPGMMAGAMYNPDEEVIDAHTLESQHPGILAKNQIDPSKTPQVRVKYNKMAQMMDPSAPPMMVQGVTPQMATFTGADASQFVGPKVPGAVPGAVAPSSATPKEETGPQGQKFFVRPSQTGLNTPIPGAINPAFVPNTNTTQQYLQSVGPDGQPVYVAAPKSTVSQKGEGVAPLPGSSAPHAATGATFPRFSENQLNTAGQKAVSDIDGVLSQVQDIKKQLQARGLDKKDDRSYYPDYLRYAHGGVSGPDQGLWTAISFERLRSGGAALQGMSSRALPIIQEAMQHAPDPSGSLRKAKLPDTPKLMYEKLTEMENILTRRRAAVMQDEKKSGVVQPLPSGGAAAGGKIRVKRVSDGQTGTIDAADFDSAKYEKIK